jgi:4a-hydroxytetrahydrobiopterin dehydratase
MTISDLKFQSGHITQPLNTTELDEYLDDISDWQVSGLATASLTRDFTCKDFVTAMALAEAIAQLAERYNHHPALTITYGNLQVSWWTHTASGITGNDVFMALQCDLLYFEN